MGDKLTLKNWGKSDIKTEIDENILNTVKKSVNNEVFVILEKQISISKRIRSFFLYLLTKGNIEKQDFLKISTAIELFHQSTLIMDDIIDDSQYREGDRNVLHTKLGKGIKGIGLAQHFAEILTIIANKELLDFGNNYISKEFENIKLQMYKAQLKDVLFIKKPKGIKYLDFLFNESYQKTTSFIQFPFIVSNILNGTKNEKLDISKKLGILYQIADDLEDINKGYQTGTLSLTYPLCYILDNPNIITENENSFLNKLLKKGNIIKTDSIYLRIFFTKYIHLFKEDIKNRLTDIKNDIEKIDNLELKQLFQDIILGIFKDDYWNYDFINNNS